MYSPGGECLEDAAKLCEAWPLVDELIALTIQMLVDDGSHCPDEEGYDPENCEDCIRQKAFESVLKRLLAELAK
jgi:hypothetical protein